MSLPAALAARLSKRGLISDNVKPIEYDLYHNYKGVVNCPNKNNIYHDCTNWCQAHWKGFLTPDLRYTRSTKRLLEKYPLPHNWTEVFDKGLGKYYFWNMETDTVSWLPPRHPRAVTYECAAKLRMRLHNPQQTEIMDRELDRKREYRENMYKDRRTKDKRADENRRYDDRDRNRKRAKNDEPLDPMDPAAYSDLPRGTWSDGLENRSKADTTASGALFQQRPYPSPGDVLNANKQKTKRN